MAQKKVLTREFEYYGKNVKTAGKSRIHSFSLTHHRSKFQINIYLKPDWMFAQVMNALAILCSK